MRQVVKTIDVYTFDELDKKVQERLISKEIGYNIELYEFDESGEWVEKLKEAGFEDAKIWYSCCSQQGDGACFDATCNVATLFSKLGINDPVDSFEVYVKQCGSWNVYSHEFTRKIIVDVFNDEISDERVSEIEEVIEGCRVQLCKQIYETIRQELDYLGDRDNAIEALKEHEFYKNGHPFEEDE